MVQPALSCSSSDSESRVTRSWNFEILSCSTSSWPRGHTLRSGKNMRREYLKTTNGISGMMTRRRLLTGQTNANRVGESSDGIQKPYPRAPQANRRNTPGCFGWWAIQDNNTCLEQLESAVLQACHMCGLQGKASHSPVAGRQSLQSPPRPSSIPITSATNHGGASEDAPYRFPPPKRPTKGSRLTGLPAFPL